jgi:hypothetical protein
MSLINDALKRARQQQKNVPAPGPDLAPVRAKEPDHHLHLLLSLLVVGLFLVAGGLIYFALRSHTVQRTPNPNVPFVAAPTPASPAPAPLLVAATSAPAVAPVALTSAAPVQVPAPPQPPGPRLQGIFYDAAAPTAIISGKTMHVGDSLNGYRVKAITPTVVTLIAPDQSETNLVMSQ